MIKTLEFEIPRDEQVFENAKNAEYVLVGINQFLEELIKLEKDDTVNIATVRNRFCEIMVESGVNI